MQKIKMHISIVDRLSNQEFTSLVRQVINSSLAAECLTGRAKATLDDLVKERDKIDLLKNYRGYHMLTTELKAQSGDRKIDIRLLRDTINLKSKSLDASTRASCLVLQAWLHPHKQILLLSSDRQSDAVMKLNAERLKSEAVREAMESLGLTFLFDAIVESTELLQANFSKRNKEVEEKKNLVKDLRKTINQKMKDYIQTFLFELNFQIKEGLIDPNPAEGEDDEENKEEVPAILSLYYELNGLFKYYDRIRKLRIANRKNGSSEEGDALPNGEMENPNTESVGDNIDLAEDNQSDFVS